MTVTPTPTLEPTQANAEPWNVDGMPLLVNKEHPLPEDYTCANLVNMADYCDPDVVKIKANGIEGEQVAVDALMVMLQAAQAEGIDNWQVSAGWRSVGYQQQLLDDKIAEYKAEGFSSTNARSAALKTVAEPGTSEHHTGLAFDITVPGVSFKGTEQSDWISEHCWEYGLHPALRGGQGGHHRLCGRGLALPLRGHGALPDYAGRKSLPGGIYRKVRPGGGMTRHTKERWTMRYGVIWHPASRNLGDDLQTLAAGRLLPRIDTVLDGERLDEAPGEPGEDIITLMGGHAMRRKYHWPPHPSLRPVCLGLHLSREDAWGCPMEVMEGVGLDYLRAHGPVGCRDDATADLLDAWGWSLTSPAA